MNKILPLFLIIFFSIVVNAQEEKPFFDFYEAAAELGLGGAIYGAQFKANHNWIDKKRYAISSGIGFSSFWGKPNSYTSYNPYLVERSNISGFATDNHLRIYSGAKLFAFKNQRAFFSAEGYVGGFHAYQRGSYTHERLDVDQPYAAGQMFFDYGTRLGIGVRLYQTFGVSLHVTNSLRQLGYGYKLLPTLYQYETDNKQSLGLSFYWKM